MKKHISKWVLVGGFTAVVLAGCGGGGGGGAISLYGACTQDQTIAAVDVVNYTQGLNTFTDETSKPIDISCRTLATDETLLPQIL